MPVPVHQLATIEDYLVVLDGHSSKYAPGEQFAYCNAGYVVLALIAERASGMPFHELVEQRVCRRAGSTDTAFLRSDELPARTALGYVEVDGAWRSNVFLSPCAGAATAGSTPRPRTCARSGGHSSPVGSSPRTGSRRWFGRAATPRTLEALRAGLLAPRVERRRPPGGVRRGCLVRVRARSARTRDAHGDLETSGGAWPIARYPRMRLQAERLSSKSAHAGSRWVVKAAWTSVRECPLTTTSGSAPMAEVKRFLKSVAPAS